MLRHRLSCLVVLTCLAAISVGTGGSARAAAYLIAPSDDDNPTFRSSIQGLLPAGDTVDYFDAGAATPTLAMLQAYDAVYTFANVAYNDESVFGNTLADYVDAGGRVVLGAFTTYALGNSLSGRIMDPGYSPVESLTGNNLFSDSSYVGDGSVLWGGVTSYTAFYRDDVVLQGNGVLDGTFADGAIAGAYRPDLGVIYIGGMETFDPSRTSGDADQLLANTFSLGQTAAVVPEPTSLTIFLIGLACLGAGGLVRCRRNPAATR